MHNDIPFDFGRLDLNKRQSYLSLKEYFDIIKIFDIRKYNYIDEVHIFLLKKKIFLKVKSKIVEVTFLLSFYFDNNNSLSYISFLEIKSFFNKIKINEN